MEIALAIVGTISLIGVILMVETHVRKRADRAWHKAAKRLGGTFTPLEGDHPFDGGARSRTLQACVRDQRVLVDHVKRGKSLLTRIRTRYAGPRGFKLTVDVGALARVERAFGGQDVETLDRAFDARFVVASSAPGLAVSWLDGGTRRAILAASDYWFEVDEGSVEALRTGLETDEVRLVAAMTAVARLATRETELRRQWGRLGAALGTVRGGKGRWPSIEIPRDGITVRVSVQFGSESDCRTELRISPPNPDRERFVLGTPRPSWAEELAPVHASPLLPARSEDPSATEARLAAVREQLEAIQPRALHHDGRDMCVVLEGIVMDNARLGSSANLLARLAGRGVSPYR